MPRVDLSTPTYRRLLLRAESFDDKAEDVVRRLLDQVEGGDPPRPEGDGPEQRFGSRATPGSILPERDYWVPILAILAEEGGAADSNYVIDTLEARMADRLTPGDFEVLRMGEVRWRNRARFARLRMRERGLLSNSSPRGIWELTEAGQDYLNRNWDKWKRGLGAQSEDQ
jgi:hypothetical protein